MRVAARQAPARSTRARCWQHRRRAAAGAGRCGRERIGPRPGHGQEALRRRASVDARQQSRDRERHGDSRENGRGRSANGPTATMGSRILCSRDLESDPITAPVTRPRPCVDIQTSEEPNPAAVSAIAAAESSPTTTCTCSAALSGPRTAAASRRRTSTSSARSATLTACDSAPKRAASARAVCTATAANLEPSRVTRMYR